MRALTNEERLAAFEVIKVQTVKGEVGLPHLASFALGGVDRIPSREEILRGMNPNVIMVGLNASAPLEEEWQNFHKKKEGNGRQFDHRIYELLKKETFSCFKGAYMTDIGKGYVNAKSSDFMKYVKSHPEYEEYCKEILRREIDLLAGKDTIILCFGKSNTAKLLGECQIKTQNGYHVFALTHYSYVHKGCGNDEVYYESVRETLEAAAKEYRRIHDAR